MERLENSLQVRYQVSTVLECLVLGPKCKGEIVIKRSIKINKTKKPRFNTRTVTTPLGLKQRWRPFGWSELSRF